MYSIFLIHAEDLGEVSEPLSRVRSFQRVRHKCVPTRSHDSRLSSGFQGNIRRDRAAYDPIQALICGHILVTEYEQVAETSLSCLLLSLSKPYLYHNPKAVAYFIQCTGLARTLELVSVLLRIWTSQVSQMLPAS